MNLARWPWFRRWFGSRSERAAEKYLRRQGYRVLRRNDSSKYGELDLVALDGSCIVFVEVRSTGTADADRPALSVDVRKQRQLTRLAQYFLQRHKLHDRPARFDVLALHWPAGCKEPTITHYKQAFEAVE